jgi:predicted RNA-binding Zn ribbon-like protein
VGGVTSAASQRRTHRWIFHLSGGRLCLDLANTVSWRRGNRPTERLGSYDDLLAWARQSRLLSSADARQLGQEAGRRPAAARAALHRIQRLREAIYSIFSALAADRSPPVPALRRVNAELRAGVRHLELVPARAGYAVAWRGGGPLVRQILWPVARSVAEVLTTDDLRRLRTCPAADCGWVFFDTTRSATRRWCDMTVCGNRAKARRHYRRHRGPTRRGSPARPAARGQGAGRVASAETRAR